MIRVFCSRCGSPIYAYRRTASDVVRIRLGSLDIPFDRPPSVHTFVGERAPWETVADGAPHFEERADPSASTAAIDDRVRVRQSLVQAEALVEPGYAARSERQADR
jgi:hypothetical protein